MYGRWFGTLVVCFWFASMSWLAAEKILPALLGGNPPDYQSALETPRELPDRWGIKWKERPLGFAASQVERLPGGSVQMRSVVHFDELPVESMAAELFGPLAAFVKPLFVGQEDLRIELLVATRTDFDAEQRLQGFQTVIDVADRKGLLRIDGQLQAGGKLLVVVSLDQGRPGSGGGDVQVFRREIDLPPEALVGDALTPTPELKNLFVGQTWTVPVYRAFPPNSPVQIVQAKVERHDIIFWESRDTEALLVVYRSVAGSEVNVAREPLGREWILSDGTVLRREISFSGLQLRFERLPETVTDARTELLDTNLHPRLWQAGTQE